MRVLFIAPTVTLGDGRPPAPTPTDYASAGIGALLSRVAARIDGDTGAILLARDAADALGLPIDGQRVTTHHALDDALTAGWRASSLGDWSTFRREGVTLYVGLDHLIGAGCPLRGPTIADTVARFAQWYELTGTVWHHGSAVAGVEVIRAVTRVGAKGPTWHPSEPGPDDAEELPYVPSQWRYRGDPGTRFIHVYDANRAYIGAASVVEVCPWTLRPSGRHIDLTRAGWWRVELAPWQLDTMPDPAGYGHTDTRERWITTPTLALLSELTAEGVYGGVRVIESLTGPGRRLLRPWAERMRDAYALRTPDGRTLDADALDADALRRAVKDAGRGGLGMLASHTSRGRRHAEYRPDWWHAVVAQARVNLWRRAWRAHRAGRQVLQIDTDKVWFGSDDPEPARSAPPGFERIDNSGNRLGAFKSGTVARRKRRKGES